MQAPGKRAEAGEQPRGPGRRRPTSCSMTGSTRTRMRRSGMCQEGGWQTGKGQQYAEAWRRCGPKSQCTAGQEHSTSRARKPWHGGDRHVRGAG